MMDSRLYSLLKVAEYSNYTRAAEQLSLTQPAVSQHIRSLEEELNIKIFERVNNKLHITYKYSKNSFHEDVATVLQSQWGALGCVDVDFDATEGNVYYSQIDEGAIEIGRYGLQTDDSAMTMLKNWTAVNLVTPLMNDPEQTKFDQMINDAWAVAADPAAFAEALHKAEDYLIQEEVLQFPLFQFAQAGLVQSNVKDYKLHIATLDFMSCTKG